MLLRWVNIGKERDGMTPDAVQYARALRPPYHLLSFLRYRTLHLLTYRTPGRYLAGFIVFARPRVADPFQ